MSPPIQRQVIGTFTFEFFQFLRIGTINPTRCRYVDLLIDGFHFILIFQAVGHHLKLQHTDCTDHNIVVVQRKKYLR